MKFFWNNTTKIAFGENAVKEHLPNFIKPKSKVLCTFGGGSIDKNGARKDVEEVLKSLNCEVRWEGGIPPNPEYDRLVEIVAVVREFNPDLVLAVGGGSVLDGTKFICLAAKQDQGVDLWETIMINHTNKNEAYPLASVMTLPATGSEWNCGFVVSRRSKGMKLGGGADVLYPQFSLLDPKYTMTLPVRQLRNGVFDAFTHVVDLFLTPVETPMFDNFWMSILKELYDIGVPLVQPNSSIELHGRLIVAASFALNGLFMFGQIPCVAIHGIGHMLTAKYEIDHGTTLAMVMPAFLESQFEKRKVKYAKVAEFVFGIHNGTVDEKARAFIAALRKWIHDLGIPETVSKWEGAKIAPGDVDELTKMAIQQSGRGKAFGYDGCATEQVVHDVFQKIVV